MTCKEISTGESECHAAKAGPISWLPRHQKIRSLRSLLRSIHSPNTPRERERLDSSVTVPRENKPERYRKINIKSAKSMHKQQESIYIYIRVNEISVFCDAKKCVEFPAPGLARLLSSNVKAG